MKTQSKVNIIIISVLCIAGSWFIFKSYKDKKLLKDNGVYVIGVKHKYKSGGNKMGSSYYEYFYNNVRYDFSISDGGYSKSLLFFRILSSDPNICRIVNDIEVPSCLTIKDVPKEGWKELPLEICK